MNPNDAVAQLLPGAEKFLCDLIHYPSTPGQEHALMLFAEHEFKNIPGVVVERVAMSNAIKADPDYSTPVPDIEYEGRFNLRIVRGGAGGGGGKKLLFNAHTDVVPASEGQVDPFDAKVRDIRAMGAALRGEWPTAP